MINTELATIRPATTLSLHEIGFKVVPLSIDGKTPAIGWTSVYDNGWSREELSQHYSEFANIATCFGKSHVKDQDGKELYLNCVDIDSQKVYYELFNQKRSFTAWASENTYCTKTRKPNGWHVYWLSHEQNAAIKTERCRQGFEFEIKTDKSSGLCTLPPSRHRDDPTFRYKALGREDSIIISDELYPSLLKLLGQFLAPEKPATANIYISFDNVDDEAPVELGEQEIGEIVAELRPLYKKDYRHALCLALAGYLHKNAVSFDSGQAIFQELVKDDEEKRTRLQLLHETFRKKRSEVSGYRALFQILCTIADEKKAATMIKRLYKTIMQHKDAQAFSIAQALKQNFTFRTMNDTREVYYYEGGRYVPNGERKIELECAALMPEIDTGTVREVIEVIRRTTPADRPEFDADLDLIPMKNGLYRVSTGALQAHTPAYLSLIQHPFEYDEGVKCENFSKFFEQVTYDSERDALLDQMAYSFYRRHVVDVINICVGQGSNGKNTFLSTLGAMHGPELTSHTSLSDIMDGRFGKANLEGKNINITFETRRLAGLDVAALKDITSKDKQQVERKGLQAYDVYLHAKMWSSVNDFPELDDDSDAMIRRVNIINFPYKFEGADDDPHLGDKLIQPHELSGIFNLLAPRLKEIIRTGKAKMSQDSIEMRRKAIMLARDPVPAFADAMLVDYDKAKNPEQREKKETVYDSFLLWAHENKAPKLSRETFGRRFKALGYNDKREREGKDRIYYWLDVKLGPL